MIQNTSNLDPVHFWFIFSRSNVLVCCDLNTRVKRDKQKRVFLWRKSELGPHLPLVVESVSGQRERRERDELKETKTKEDKSEPVLTEPDRRCVVAVKH